MSTPFKQRFQQYQKQKQVDEFEKFVRPNYTFHSNFNKQKSCITSTDEYGRVYEVSDSEHYHSVTTVLSMTKSEKSKKALERWKKRVGEEEAERIKNAAAARGSILHDLCEKFITKFDEFVIPDYGTNDYYLFRQIYPLLCRINNIHNMEGVLYSKRLSLAGRVDCIAEFDGELSIIDFKTAVKEKEDWMLLDYYTQETCYALMFAEMYNIKIKQIVTLMAVDYDMSAKQGLIFIKKPVDYVQEVINRVKKYKKIINNSDVI